MSETNSAWRGSTAWLWGESIARDRASSIPYSVLQRSVPPLRGDTAVLFIYFISLFHSADGMHWQIFSFGRVRLAQESGPGAPGVGQANRPDLATDTKRVSLIQQVRVSTSCYVFDLLVTYQALLSNSGWRVELLRKISLLFSGMCTPCRLDVSHTAFCQNMDPVSTSTILICHTMLSR